MADPSGPAKQERLTSHQGQRQKKQPPGSFPDFFMPFSPGHHPSQTEEQRSQEDAVSGVAAYGENPLVYLRRQRMAGHQPVPAVAAQADQIQQSGDDQASPQGKPAGKEIHQADALRGGRKIPQMVKGAVKEQHFEKSGCRQSFHLSRVQVQGQIQKHGQDVQSDQMRHRTKQPPACLPGPLPVAVLSAVFRGIRQQEKSGDHQEKRNRHPAGHPCQKKVCGSRKGSQRRGMNGDHQKRRRDTEGVKAGVIPLLACRFPRGLFRLGEGLAEGPVHGRLPAAGCVSLPEIFPGRGPFHRGSPGSPARYSSRTSPRSERILAWGVPT